jgi:hypothetical protein
MDYSKLGISDDLLNAVKSVLSEKEMHPNQKVLDKNKNGKLDADDFKKLRGESSCDEDLDESDKVYDPITKKMVTRKPIKVKMGGGATKNGVPVTESTTSVKEEVEELDEATSPMQKLRDAHDRHMEKALAANKAGDDEATKVHQQYMQKITDKMNKLKRNEEVELGEEVQILDELSKSTLKSYVKKAGAERKNLISKVAGGSGELSRDNPRDPEGTKARLDANKTKKIKRTVGLGMATGKLKNKPMFGEEVEEYMQTEAYEQLDELSKKTLSSYVKSATGDLAHTSELRGAGSAQIAAGKPNKDIPDDNKLFNKQGKRIRGIFKAVNKLTKEQVEEIESLAVKHGLVGE